MNKHITAAIALFFIATIVAACAIPPPNRDYIVMLTDRNVSQEERCAGVMIDNFYIVTANHCTHFANRVVDIHGNDASVSAVERWESYDIALLKAREPIPLQTFATFAAPTVEQAGILIGMCPQYIGLTERYVAFRAHVDTIVNPGSIRLLLDQWVSTDIICGGDSGGVVLQNEKVVGIINASDLSYFTGMGESAYVTDGMTVQSLLCSYNPEFNICPE